MAVSPGIFSINYRKNSGQAPYQLVIVKADQAIQTESNFQLRNVPSWLKVALEQIVYVEGSTTNVDYFRFRVSVDPENANLLPAGMVTADVSFRLRVSPLDLAWYWQTLNMKVNLTVYDSELLSIDKTSFNFNYYQGEAQPNPQYLQITSGNDWSITADQPWVNFDISNGNGSATVAITPNVSGLNPGLHSSVFTVEDSTGVKSGSITLWVYSAGGGEDYLNADPSSMQFSETLGEAPVKQKTLNIDSSLGGTITSNVSWLGFSAATFNAGQTSITVNTQATEALAIGSYYADITISTNYGTEVIPVLLQIVEIQLTGIEDNGFYYADDRNKLLLTSSLSSGEVIIEHTASSAQEIKKYRKKAPYFRNTANLVIGVETNNILKPNPVPENLHTHSFLPIKPVRYDLIIYDKDLTTNTQEQRQSFQNLNFINGRTPLVEGLYTQLPSSIATPKDGVLCFCFRSETPVDNITVSGDRTEIIDVESLGSNIYGVMLDLSDFNLNTQEKISLVCGPVNIQVRIKPAVHPTAQIIWLNEWDCPEIFNATGLLQIVKEDESTQIVRAREGREYKRVVDIKNPKRFTIGTGNIYGAEEIKFLSGLLEAKDIWLQVGEDRFPVIRDFRDMLFSETRKNTDNVNLTFKSAIV